MADLATERTQHHTGIRFRKLLKEQTRLWHGRPDFGSSPFSVKPFHADTEIALDDITIEAMPHLTFYTDTHLVAPHLINEGYDTLSSGKRRFFGLSRNTSIRRNVRMLDDISYIMLRQIGPHLQQRYHEGGLVVHGGDVIDSYETSNCFRTFAELERFHGKLHAAAAPTKHVRTRSIWITGNHDTFFGGVEKWFEYNQIRHRFGDFSRLSFMATVRALKAGATWHEISDAWESAHTRMNALGKLHRIQRALHPAFRWYLERLTFGPAQGMFVHRDTELRIVAAVFFLDSELMTLHGGVHTLQRALQHEGFTESDPLYREVVGYRQQEARAQTALIDELLKLVRQGIRPVVYGHNPRQLQSVLREQFAEQRGADKHDAGIRQLIEDNVMIYGGHYHTASHDIVDMPPGIQPVRAATRLFIGPFGQKPGRLPFTMSLDKYMDSLAPEILEGPLDRPTVKRVEGVKEAFISAMKKAA